MDGIKNLINSEKGLVGLLLIAGVTVLAALDKVSFDAWQNYTKWIFLIYVGGKTVQGAVSTMSDAKVAAATAKASTPVADQAPVATTNVLVAPSTEPTP